MTALNAQTNPFILMMDPQSVLSQIENSERLERLHRRICRPLDKLVLQPGGSTAGAASDFDAGLIDDDSADDDSAESDLDIDLQDDAV